MEKASTPNQHSSHLFLTGTILLANMNYSDLMDYGIKAFIGGAIWLGFKLVGDYLGSKILRKKDSGDKS